MDKIHPILRIFLWVFLGFIILLFVLPHIPISLEAQGTDWGFAIVGLFMVLWGIGIVGMMSQLSDQKQSIKIIISVIFCLSGLFVLMGLIRIGQWLTNLY